MTRKHYVVGLVFEALAKDGVPDHDGVLLIEKNHPEWQHGRLNGIGGRLLDGESPLDAMVREFEEEAGVRTSPDDWQLVVQMAYPAGLISFFRSFSATAYREARTMTSERVRAYGFHRVQHRLIENLNWIIPLCLHCDACRSGSKLVLPVCISEDLVQ